MKFDFQDVPEPAADQPTQVIAKWEVTLDGKRVGELRALQHRTAVRCDDGGVAGWTEGAVESAYDEGSRGKTADPGDAGTRKVTAIAAVCDRRLADDD